MAPIVNSRKRTRSIENDHYLETQTKYFINEQTVNANDLDKMKQIHDKTIQMLFRNANTKSNNNNNNETPAEPEMSGTNHSSTKWNKFNDNFSLMGNGQVNYMTSVPKMAIDNSSVLRRCHLCAKPSTIQAIDCVNCNLELCEFCGISCMQCNAPLCVSCIQLFGCWDNSVDMNACCQSCKQIYNIQ